MPCHPIFGYSESRHRRWRTKNLKLDPFPSPSAQSQDDEKQYFGLILILKAIKVSVSTQSEIFGTENLVCKQKLLLLDCLVLEGKLWEKRAKEDGNFLIANH
ncbi:MAG: hypothetical protein HY761_03715 [Candidatus Omnitrophica bacterium]|nr:hypothetical protein [Candidatus Omnitrophota bacterium]